MRFSITDRMDEMDFCLTNNFFARKWLYLTVYGSYLGVERSVHSWEHYGRHLA